MAATQSLISVLIATIVAAYVTITADAARCIVPAAVPLHSCGWADTQPGSREGWEKGLCPSIITFDIMNTP
jgi:hypothetical protein